MTDRQKQRALKILHSLIEVDPVERHRLLEETCAADPALKKEVERLLALEGDASRFMETMEGPSRGREAGEAETLPLDSLARFPEQMGCFRLLDILGEGGMGVVYLAEQTEPVRRRVALKLIRPGMDTREVVARFEAERQALALMDHPGVAKVYEAGSTADGRPYFAMEYVQGVPITEYCDRHCPNVRERLELFVRACDGVQHAHQKGIIHRDLKPSNILVSTVDRRATAKIIDFGIAKAIDHRLTEKTLYTELGRAIGTPAYMSPEQAELSAESIDHRTDIYSLGVVLFELLTEELPFRGTPQMLLVQIQREEPPSPRKLNGLVGRDLETICLKCLDKDPDRRYGSAGELGEDVRRFLNAMPIRARSVSSWERAWIWAKRRPALAALSVVSAVAALALVAVAVGFAYNFELQDALKEAQEARQAEEKQRKTAQLYQYFHDIALAHAEWRDGNVGRVEPLLDDCPIEERGWEWSYLKRLVNSDLLTIRTDTNFLGSLAFSPDGESLAAVAEDRTIKLWRLATGREERTLSGHTDKIARIALSPDGTRLVSASRDRTVKVWDALAGEETLTFNGHTAYVAAVAFSPDGARVASGAWDSTVRVWDAGTGRELFPALRERDLIFDVAFSPDGSQIVSCGGNGTVTLWDAETGQLIRSLEGGHQGQVRSVEFSPDGRQIVSGGQDRTVRLWDVGSGKEVGRYEGHRGDVWNVCFSPDGSRLASCSIDQTVRVWETLTGRPIRTLKGHRSEVVEPAFHPDGTWLASAASDGTVRIWDLTVDQSAMTLRDSGPGAGMFTNGIAFGPKGDRLAAVSGDSVDVWDTTTGQLILELPHGDEVEGVAFDPQGRWLASAGSDKLIRIWDALVGKEIRSPLRGHGDAIRGLAFGPDGLRLASASRDRSVKIWDISGNAVTTCEGHRHEVLCVTFGPDGKWVVSGSRDRTARVWEVATGELAFTMSGFQDPVLSVAFTSDGKRLATGVGFNVVKLWDAATFRQTHVLVGHSSDVLGVAFTPDGTRLASASRDGTMKIWQTATGRETMTLMGRGDWICGVAFDGSGARLASVSGEGTVRLWDARPLIPEVRLERQALSLVRFLFARPLPRSAVLRSIADNRWVSEPVRRQALSFAKSFREEQDPRRYYDAAWDVLRSPYSPPVQYRYALSQAEAACRLSPESGPYLTALGLAHYRLGEYSEALQTLTRAQQLNSDDPATLAFLAMTQYRTGDNSKARGIVERLRESMKGRVRPDDREGEAFLGEAETLLEAGQVRE